MVITNIPAIVLLHAACAVVYGVLAALILGRTTLSRTGGWLAFACAITAVWAAVFALAWWFPIGRFAEWLEIGRSAAWYGFILHLYRRSVGANEQLTTAFKTMGLLAVLVLFGTPLLEWLSGPTAPSFESLSTTTRLGLAVCNVLLLENLYFNTPSESRWNINLLCVALGGVFLYDVLLYADAVLFHRLSFELVEARAPAIILAAPLIALAAVRNRRWAVDIHVSRDVVFHSFTLIGSGIFLLAIALIGEVFRRGGSEWGRVAETSMLFGAILAVAVTLTSGSARSRIKSIVVENFFSHRYDYRKRMDALHRRADRTRGIRRAAQTSHPGRSRGGGQPRRGAVRAAAAGRRVPMGRFLEHAGGDQPGTARASAGDAVQGRRLDRAVGRAHRTRKRGFRSCRVAGSYCR